MTDETLRVGDVALDLAQGRAVQVVAVDDDDAATWSEREDYDLCENYGNSRLDASPTDRVLHCVYCNSLKSEPSKSYAFPESRLARITVEQADEDPARIQGRLARQVLADLFDAAAEGGAADALRSVAVAAGYADVVDDARELAETRGVVNDE